MIGGLETGGFVETHEVREIAVGGNDNAPVAEGAAPGDAVADQRQTDALPTIVRMNGQRVEIILARIRLHLGRSLHIGKLGPELRECLVT